MTNRILKTSSLKKPGYRCDYMEYGIEIESNLDFKKSD